jgi:hypothetical protein
MPLWWALVPIPASILFFAAIGAVLWALDELDRDPGAER